MYVTKRPKTQSGFNFDELISYLEVNQLCDCIINKLELIQNVFLYGQDKLFIIFPDFDYNTGQFDY